MSPACSAGPRLALLALLACASSAGAKAPAASPVVPFDCSGEVCGFNVTDPALVTAPCAQRAVLVAFSRTSGATLVQCSSPGSSQDNLVYVFDRSMGTGPVYELEGGRYIAAAVLTQAATDGIPDRFGPVPLCSAPTAAVAGELTLLVKEPTGGEHPYCYRRYHASIAAGGLQVGADGASAVAPAPDARARWTRLVAGLTVHIGPVAPAHAPDATVGVAKARLYARPDSQASTRMYLVRGDAVTVLDTAGCAGWSRIRYVTASGKPIERWIRNADLAK